MSITDNVVRDLLPLVHAGEASADTRALVEAYLTSHPELAEESRRAESWTLPAVTAVHNDERQALRRTKKLLSRRSWALALGCFFTGMPLSFRASSDSFQFLLLPEHPWIAAVSLCMGIAAWLVYLRTSRALKPSGF